MADVRPHPSPRKLLSFGTASLGLATVAELVGNIEKIKQFVTEIIGLRAFKNLHLMLTVIVVAALILGYAAASYWIYLTFRRRSLGTRIAVAVLAIVLMVGLAAGSFALIPPPPDADAYRWQKVKEWSDRLLAHPTASGGVSVTFSDPQAPPQAWTSAQALRAVLASGVDISPLAEKIRKAFDYIEASRIKAAPGGWGYFEDWQTGVTEIAGWACVAHIASIDPKRRDIVWPPERVSEIVERTARVVQLLVSSQQDDGGWGPTADRSYRGLSRTYSTAMATWCLVEAHGSSVLSSRAGDSYGRAINNGLTWLLSNYQPNLGWVPNPSRKGQNEPFLGLTAQVLYVLAQAQAAPQFVFIAALPNAALAKKEFLALDFEQRKLTDNTRLHDGDRYVHRAASTSTPGACVCPFTIENSTFLWYPWSMASARALAMDQNVTADQRAKAGTVAETLTARLSEANLLIDTGFHYIMAEFLIGASHGGPQKSEGQRKVAKYWWERS